MTEQDYTARVRDATVESVADLFMDLRLDGPSGEGWTYQQTARHYAKVIVEHFRRWRPAASNPGLDVETLVRAEYAADGDPTTPFEEQGEGTQRLWMKRAARHAAEYARLREDK